jgi:hypothetical protein
MTKELKAAVAKRRIAKFRPGWEDLDLTEFSTIAEDAALLVAQVEGSIDLRSVVEISDTVAAIFGKQRGSLDLSGLKSLSNSAAESLAQHDGWLYLGIEELDDDIALALSSGIATLSLNNLRRLDATPGHIALATKLITEGTANRLYSLENISKDLLEAVPDLRSHIG